MISLHFAGFDPQQVVVPIAGVLGVGRMTTFSGVQAERYERLKEVAPSRYRVAPVEEADAVVYPHDLLNTEAGDVAGRLAQRHGKPCLFFHGADDGSPIPLERGTLFRMSLYSSTRLPHERAMPALGDDLLGARGEVALRSFSESPAVGFCGYVSTPLRRYALNALGLDRLGGLDALGLKDKSAGLTIRERSLSSLEQAAGLVTRFIRREQFWGGALSRVHLDVGRQDHVRSEFTTNVLDTDYGLCVRGKGNFSYRLYEVLSAGRIPIFVNTRCVMPFDDQIDWRRHMVWVEESELDHIGRRVREFHHDLGPEGFQRLQLENRKLWEEWLSPVGFYQKIFEELSTRAGTLRA